jgi:hypothetical protein
VALLLGCIAGAVVASLDHAGAWIVLPIVVFLVALSGVWQVADTAKAMFAVDDYPGFVSVQAESALRHGPLPRRGRPSRDADR